MEDEGLKGHFRIPTRRKLHGLLHVPAEVTTLMTQMLIDVCSKERLRAIDELQSQESGRKH